MGGHIACIAAVLLGVDAGWERLPDGGMLYIIQVEPELVDTLRSGEAIQSDLRPEIRDVRALRIVVGTGELPREEPPAVVEPAAMAPVADPPSDPFAPSGMASDWPPAESAPPGNWPSGFEMPAVPNPIPPDPEVEPAEAGAVGNGEPESPAADEEKSPTEEEARREPAEPEPSTRPWGWLIVALFTLSGSLGANVYLGWIVRGTRGRYRQLLEEQTGEGGEAREG